MIIIIITDDHNDEEYKGLSIYYEIRGRGLPNLLQYCILCKCIGGFFKDYYNITDLVGIWRG